MENVASRFGQRLAHTEKKYRDQALKKLTTYLTKRAEWSALEWDKLWKALFYCMWMSDKRPVQDELSTNLAALVHKIPSIEDALGFVDSFFRTMHREWHGIDGLRLDKFYSLIRKFVHQTLVLLKHHDFERVLVERFVSILSSEIMSQLPNGLRLHTTDLFLTELHGAAGDDVDTETFLLLLEPFFTLLSSEYDKTVFKRVRELVFLPMLSTYKFGPQPPKTKKSSEENETDGEEDEDEDIKVFEDVELPFVQHRIFSIASADDTAERNRSVLYDLYSHFFKVTKIDSLKASQDGTLMPKKKVSKKRKEPETNGKGEAVDEDESSKKKKKNKRRKKNKQDEEDATIEEADKETPVAEVATPEKKSKKKTENSKTPVNTPVKSASEEAPSKKQKKAKATEDVLMEAAKTLGESTAESTKKSKKDKKKKTEAEAETEEPMEVETPSKKSNKDKKKNAEPETEDVMEVETPAKKSKKDNKKKVEADADVEMQEEVTPSKKTKKDKKKAEADAVPESQEEETPSKKSKKDKKAKLDEVIKKQVEEEVAAKLEEVVLSKKDKKEKKDKKKTEVEEVTPSKKDKKKNEEATEPTKPKVEIVVRSGMKFRRCGGCGGIGKGLVPVAKDLCRHCERTGQQKKKALVADKKKRKAEVLAAGAAEEASAASKKVTFGKNRALAHELSVKRLKASKAVVKELTSEIKGVLKAGSSPADGTKKSKKTGGRMKAADFF